MSFNQRNTVMVSTIDSKEVMRALNKLPKEIQNQIRDDNKIESDKLVDVLKRTVTGAPPQAQLVQKAIYSRRDRYVRVEIGGDKQVGRKYKSKKSGRKYGASAGWLMYGAEHGGSGQQVDRSGRKMGNRFVLNHNKQGYWISPRVERFGKDIAIRWAQRVNDAVRKVNLDG